MGLNRPNLMHFVFDFGRVLFDWQPERLLQRLLPQRAFDEASSAHWVAQVFQAYQGDWGDFDRGSVSPADLVPRIAKRTGLAPAEVQLVVDAVPQSLQPIPASLGLAAALAAAGAADVFPVQHARTVCRPSGATACLCAPV